MKKRYRALCALVALSFAFSALVACKASKPPEITADAPVTEAPITEAPDDGRVQLGSLRFALEGGAKLENGILKGEKLADVNTALCESVGKMPVCIDVKVKITGTTTGGISFGYHNDERRYFLGFDKKSSVLYVTCYQGEEAYGVRRMYVPIETGTELNVRIAVNNRLVKVFVDDFSADTQALIEFSAAFSLDKGLKLDCGRGTLQFLDVSLSDYIYSNKGAETYVNPVTQGADPFVLYHEGKYYLYATTASTGYKVSVSEDLKNWTDMGFCLKDEDVYGTPENGIGFWAPEVYYIDGRFYLFYTVAANIGVAVADSPLGPFKDYSNRFLFDEGKLIDANLLIDDDGQMYLYFVGAEGRVDGAKFDLRTCTLTERTPVVSAEEGWETQVTLTCEGPFVIKHNGAYYLTYSCNVWTSHEYSVGCAVSDSPLGPFVKYEENPILVKSPAADAYGTGHHSFFYSAGGELLIAYHRHNSADAYTPRQVCIDRCAFIPQENGPDKLVIYGPTSTPQILPK